MSGKGRSGMAFMLGVVVLAIAAGGGYWLGKSGAATVATAGGEPAGAAPGKPERKIRFYRNPMGLPDTSPVPKKDSMGMDYIPVYEGEDDGAAAAATLTISADKVQKLGVRSAPVERRSLERTVRAAGRVEPDERRIYAISPKFEGYVERLHVNVTGQAVGKGQPLFEVYSPELVSAQREYAIAARGVDSLKAAGGTAHDGMRQLAESSLLRLRNWDISEEQIRALANSGEARRTLTFRSPVSGVVTEKRALQGMRFMPGDALYQVADLSSVWVLADVYEQDIGVVKTGAKARVRLAAYPDKTFEGTVSYVYPTLRSETRTVPVRLELPNPGQLLKPGMFADVELPAASREAVLTVPESAVIDSGIRQVVFVRRGEGRFEPREVKLGRRGGDHVEVLSGVDEGDAVVVAANFLIDAESNLKAALGAFGAPSASAGATTSVGHRGDGTVDAIDAKAGSLTLSHAPIASLNWPAMTMDFVAANPALLAKLKPGAKVSFEFVERQPGEWVITRIEPLSPAAGPHAGH